MICADGGSDINLMSPALCRQLKTASTETLVTRFTKPRSFGLAVSETVDRTPISVICDRQVTLDTQLFIRHDSSIFLRNSTWYVAVQRVPEPLLGRPLLEALGLNTRNTLESSGDARDGS